MDRIARLQTQLSAAPAHADSASASPRSPAAQSDVYVSRRDVALDAVVYNTVLTPDALAFVTDLANTFAADIEQVCILEMAPPYALSDVCMLCVRVCWHSSSTNVAVRAASPWSSSMQPPRFFVERKRSATTWTGKSIRSRRVYETDASISGTSRLRIGSFYCAR